MAMTDRAKWWDEHMLEVLRGASTTVVLKGLSFVLTFGLYVVVGRLLGPAGAGTYFLALTITTIAAVLGRVGLDTTLLRFTAANASVGDWVAVKGVYRKSLGIAMAAAGTTALLIVAGAHSSAAKLFGDAAVAGPLAVMSLSVVPLALLTLHGQSLQGLRRIRDANLVNGVGVPLLSLVGVLLLVPRWGVLGAAWAHVAACCATFAVSIWMWRRATPQLAPLAGHIATDELLQSSIPMFWVSALQLVIAWASTLSLGFWASAADVGTFGVANRTATLTSFVLIAINSIAAPKFAALYRLGDMATLGRIARNSTKLMAGLAAPVLATFVIFPRQVLGLFGDGFSGSPQVLSILALGQFVNVITGSVGYLLTMCGYERLQRNNFALCAALSVALNVLLVPRMGAMGAAIATSTTLAVQMLIAAAIVWRKLGVITVPLLNGRPISARQPLA
jgi:O-antigen/teichoic acid export membrane protein